ncbi:MAG TPA: hypothetical protein VFT87_04515 [Candidatus Saccharimonadales bacterium]|nr:hypothetical protein [Candidatus Saccharimonadales bacterium]
MANESDKLVTLVLVYGPRGRHEGGRHEVRVTRGQAAEIKVLRDATTKAYHAYTLTDAEGGLYVVDVGSGSGLVELFIEEDTQ